MEKDWLRWGADHLRLVTIWFDPMAKENLRLSNRRHQLNLDYSMIILYWCVNGNNRTLCIRIF